MLPSFWIILLAVLLYGFVHSFLATVWMRAQAKRWFGRLADRSFRLFYNLFAFITLLPILALPVLLIDKMLYSIPFPWVVITLIVQLVAFATLVIGLLQTGVSSFLGLRQLMPGSDDQPPQLVVNGLYRWVRHPLYTAGLVFIWLMPRMSCNLLALNIGLTVYIVVGALLEERKLLKEFGEAYAEYHRQTPMLIPGLHLRLK
jgi:protein-S-isoprenylcysteine O-methyltransferase Ste14